jgi:hypothetical protein
MRHLALAAILALAPTASQAAVISWTDWTTSNLLGATGTTGGVGVTFTGSLQFAQLGFGTMVGGGASSTTNYWTEGSPAPYTGNAVVGNAPTPFELLAFNQASTNTLVFSAPVLNPLMAIVSMGQGGVPVSYDFDTSFVVLSEGLGFWGDGTFTLGAGDVLIGRELHAVIQFQGLVSAIQWTSSAENWHGFTIGLEPQVTAVPEPGTIVLLGAGLVAVGALARRRAA